MSDYLYNNGITTKKTVPNTPQSKSFAKRLFRHVMTATRTALVAVPNMTKSLWSFATIHAADKGKYLPTSKQDKPQMSPNINIETKYPDARLPNPSTFIPW